MTDDELRDALDGLFAYDEGATDSGIHDEDLRARCVRELQGRPRGAHESFPRLLVSRMVRDMWLSEEALEQGYGLADAVGFMKWLDEQMRWAWGLT